MFNNPCDQLIIFTLHVDETWHNELTYFTHLCSNMDTVLPNSGRNYDLSFCLTLFFLSKSLAFTTRLPMVTPAAERLHLIHQTHQKFAVQAHLSFIMPAAPVVAKTVSSILTKRCVKQLVILSTSSREKVTGWTALREATTQYARPAVKESYTTSLGSAAGVRSSERERAWSAAETRSKIAYTGRRRYAVEKKWGIWKPIPAVETKAWPRHTFGRLVVMGLWWEGLLVPRKNKILQVLRPETPLG